MTAAPKAPGQGLGEEEGQKRLWGSFRGPPTAPVPVGLQEAAERAGHGAGLAMQ